MVVQKKKTALKKPSEKKEAPVVNKERRLERELLYILGFIVLLVLVFIIASTAFRSFNTFEYEGLSFTKERLGNIPVYHYFYYFTRDDGGLVKYNLYVRNDPRKNEVPVEGGEIVFPRGKRVYVSTDSATLQQCSQSVLAVSDLSSFLTDNDFTVRGGDIHEDIALSMDQEWVTCETRPDNPVIMIDDGEETRIDINGTCYQITVAACTILEATEKFKIQSILDARNPIPSV